MLLRVTETELRQDGSVLVTVEIPAGVNEIVRDELVPGLEDFKSISVNEILFSTQTVEEATES